MDIFVGIILYLLIGLIVATTLDTILKFKTEKYYSVTVFYPVWIVLFIAKLLIVITIWTIQDMYQFIKEKW